MPKSVKIQPKAKHRSNLKLLNPQQRMFVAHLLCEKNFHAPNAALAAGYKNPAQAAFALLRNKTVCEEIARELQKRIDRTQVTRDRVIYELAAIAFSNIQNILKDDDSLRKLSSLPENVARSISSIKVQYRTEFEDGAPVKVAIKEIKFWDKGKALELLARHLGMIDERLHVSGEVKIKLDYEKLYLTEQKPTYTLDPVEQQIANPTIEIPKKLLNYTVSELIGDEDNG